MTHIPFRPLPVAAILVAALLSACVTPTGGFRDGSSTAPPAIPEPITVHSLRGSATLQKGSTRTPLRQNMQIAEGQPIQVGPRSHVQLNVGKRALLDLGPNARLVVHKLPRAGDAGDRATWLRLESGYLHVIWSSNDDGRSWPLEVSFARWAGKADTGEYFFDGARHSASACVFRGDLQLSGVPENTPRTMSDPCVSLRADTAPQLIALRATDWDALRTRRTMAPTLRNAAAFETAQALANLQREMKQSRPTARRPAAARAAVAAVKPPAAAPAPARVQSPGQAPVKAAAVERPIETRIEKPARTVVPAVAPAVAPAAPPVIAWLPSSPRAVRVAPASASPLPRIPPRSPVPPVIVIETPLTIEVAKAEPEPPRDPLPEPVVPVHVPPVVVIDTPPVTEVALAQPEPPPEPEPFVPVHLPPVIVIDTPPATEVAFAEPEPPPDPLPEPVVSAHVPPVIVIETPPATEVAMATPPTVMIDTPSTAAAVLELPPLDNPQLLAYANAAPDPRRSALQLSQELSANPVEDLAPVSSPAVAEAGAETNEWMVNVASYSSAEYAEQQRRELASQGFPAAVRSETVRGHASYRVVIEGMATEAAALTTVSELDTRLGLQSAWVLRKR